MQTYNDQFKALPRRAVKAFVGGTLTIDFTSTEECEAIDASHQFANFRAGLSGGGASIGDDIRGLTGHLTRYGVSALQTAEIVDEARDCGWVFYGDPLRTVALVPVNGETRDEAYLRIQRESPGARIVMPTGRYWSRRLEWKQRMANKRGAK